MFATAVVLAQDSHYRPEGQQIPAPSMPHHERRMGRRVKIV